MKSQIKLINFSERAHVSAWHVGDGDGVGGLKEPFENVVNLNRLSCVHEHVN